MGRHPATSVAALAAALTAAVSLAGARSGAAPPPGGAAPKQLVGTFTTKLTRADQLRWPKDALFIAEPRWTLVIANSGSGASPRVLGLRPTKSGGPSIPFGVAGSRIYLRCLSDDGFPIRGHSTYTWSLVGRTLRFVLVSQPCKSPDDRSQVVVLTSEPWHKIR